MTEKDECLVSIVECKRYHYDTVKESLLSIFEPWDGLSFFARKGRKVLLKPNLLAAAHPEEAVTTHPVIMEVLADMFREIGCTVYIGDSPGNDPEDYTYDITGMKNVATKTGAEIIYFNDNNRICNKNTKECQYNLTSALDNIDLVINVAKLKTHSLTGLTGAVKNVYGCVAGKRKKKLHYEHPLPLDFSKQLVDIYLSVKPAFSIIDSVVAMEGMGPRSGKPRHVGLLIAAENAFAADLAAALITGFNNIQVTTLAVAKDMGIKGVNPKDLNIRGKQLSDCLIKDFDRGLVSDGKVIGLLARFPVVWLKKALRRSRPYPIIKKSDCIQCGKCYTGCPPQIISFKNKKPVIEYIKCIQCYCCQEFCPVGAIELKRIKKWRNNINEQG